MSTSVNELVAQAQKLTEDAIALHHKEDVSEDERARCMEMLADARKLKARAEELSEIQTFARQLDGMSGGATEAGAEAAYETHDAPHPDQRHNRRLNNKWRSGGAFLTAVRAAAGNRASADKRLVWMEDDQEFPEERRDMAEGVGATGGFLVPMEYRNDLLALAGDGAIVRPRATIIPMSRRQVTFPVIDQTGTSAQSNVYGGIVVTWTEEAAAKTEDDFEWRQMVLTAWKAVLYTRASDELVADSAISLDAFIRSDMGFVGAMRDEEDYRFIQGTGVGQPLGVINSNATISVARTATSPAFQFDDAANMMQSFKMSSRGVWAIHQTLMDEVITMSGPSGNPSYIWSPNARDGMPNMLLGFPVEWTDKTNTANTAGDVLLCDWQHYYVGDRQNLLIESTPYDRWQYDQTSWRAVHRVAGRPWLSAPLTLRDGTSQVSPFVMLGDKTT